MVIVISLYLSFMFSHVITVTLTIDRVYFEDKGKTNRSNTCWKIRSIFYDMIWPENFSQLCCLILTDANSIIYSLL